MSDNPNEIKAGETEQVTEQRAQAEGLVPGTPGGEIVAAILNVLTASGHKHCRDTLQASDLIDSELDSINESNLYGRSRELAAGVGGILWAPRHKGDTCPDGILATIEGMIRLAKMDF